MKMNLYMEISVILLLIVGFSLAYSLLKDSQKKHIKFFSFSFISGISVLLVWRATQLFSYFN
ncbi:hypothetical protein [Bacillus sp. PS06]|uniref:hypothetical protein n=1 Tax=Bacillus sp. PS06 TaxID=2764176 RepID=UPI00177D089A|nr:hypothetical protein [Bacillus sp. PS06]MBD8068024.1 hypothetical protein [Bacillus sp. PS06]